MEAPVWKKVKNPQPCWKGECYVFYKRGKAFFRYENYYIDADEVFNHLEKED